MVYDVIIIGGGPAGLSAGLYAGRGKLKTLLIEKETFGGQTATTHEVENYPGVLKVTGPELSEIMREQVENFGVDIVKEGVVEVDFKSDIKVVKTYENEFKAKTVILAMGAKPRLAGFKNENEFRSMGVSYCATCDGAFFEGLDIAVIGGGDSAITEALYLTRFAKTIKIIHRRKEFRAAKSLVKKAEDHEKIEFILDTVVEEAQGDGILENLILRNVINNEKSELTVSGCFVFVGLDPINDIIKDKIDLDDFGYVISGEDMKTNIPGVFVAGDLRQKNLRQIITAASDGAIASIMAEKYLENLD
ncbi:thioredoxin-disulfide reductase [Candidatus Arthromitus sp. SFB-turkey]|uniref:thioredoxin-disulfide reductase n=1 Tax=Candidatus Arthromitus sp. SFB-turkey TaxID=1840217 RepID=UPI0007F4F8A1|nr:thioredoxin-disulfide reductase [Candidatus Arthromitus sp. SFB-turkey]OAT87167.1 thioredoxin-disulfide reductase [Candidatus Arthromitus sp. SFB-turkey]